MEPMMCSSGIANSRSASRVTAHSRRRAPMLPLMGVLLYGGSATPIPTEDRALAHLKVVIATRRRGESLTMSWPHPDDQRHRTGSRPPSAGARHLPRYVAVDSLDVSRLTVAGNDVSATDLPQRIWNDQR